MQNYKTYKIISLTKQQPIFICKALPLNHQARLGQHLEQAPTLQKPNLFALKQNMIKVTDKLMKTRQNHQKTSLPEKRAFSFQFPKQEKLMMQAKQIQDKRKKQKSIKEYLRLVYNRAERERRSNSYRLPSLKKEESQEKVETQNVQLGMNQMTSWDLKDVSSMKRKMRDAKSRLKLGQEQNHFEGKYSFRMDKLTGWDQKQEEELGFVS